MNAGNVEKLTKNLPNFIGIFDPKSLSQIKLLSYPVALIVLVEEHWISLYITEQSIEVMDSMGYFSKKEIDCSIQRFISAHLLNKSLISTPQLQADDSNLCALYAICFLFYRALKCGSLCDFCKILTTNLSENCKIITNMYKKIKTF